MIRHIVLYTYRSDIQEPEIAEVFKKLDAISKRLPGRIAYSWGKYDSDEGRNRGYTHALVVDFKDPEAQRAFLLDSTRLEFSKQEVIPRMVGGVDGIVSFDYQIVI